MGKKAEQSEQRRKQILQIALDEFIAKGYYGTSTREISKIADISSGLMFHYFDSKTALYEALVENGCGFLELGYNGNDSPITFLKSRLDGAFQMIKTNPNAAKMFVFMENASHNAAQISQKAGELFAKHDIIKQSVPIIQKGQQFGEIRPGDSHALAIAFWCAIQGIAQQTALNPDNPLPETDWIMDILRNKGSQQ